ncbi:hypothetical protein OG21DRAFT_1407884 [Imleria badia]|nr:hypothetical protein OG21DRAFT_1407884 [Imleria badia]
MRVFTCLLLVVSSAFAYHVTYPNTDQGWTTSGLNYLEWERVDTDPTTFTVVLKNDVSPCNTNYNEILDSNVDGTLGTQLCSTPSGGWPTGSAFRVNLAQDPEHLDTLLAQSNQFNITATSSGGSTMSSASIQ